MYNSKSDTLIMLNSEYLFLQAGILKSLTIFYFNDLIVNLIEMKGSQLDRAHLKTIFSYIFILPFYNLYLSLQNKNQRNKHTLREHLMSN